MKKVLSIAAALILCVAMILSLAGCGKKDNETTTETDSSAAVTDEATTEAPEAQVLSRITGLPMNEANENGRLIGIVVENLRAARPQWGFNTPQMVLEYEVEGGITRMLWLYNGTDEIPEMVGPVRSARHDAVELSNGLDALLVHIGGSTIAYEMIPNYNSSADHLDGNSDSTFHHKDTSRNVATEHRSVVVGTQLAARIAEKNIRMTTDKTELFCFAPASAPRTLSGTACDTLHISYSDYCGYDFHYNYATSRYGSDVYTSGTVTSTRTDENGDAVEFDNVIILYTDMVAVGDSSGHQDLLLENGGQGLYLCGGVAESITWKKTSKTENVKLYGADGGELVLNAGRTYMGFVRSTQAGQTVIK